jgi:hypothetical protein
VCSSDLLLRLELLVEDMTEPQAAAVCDELQQLHAHLAADSRVQAMGNDARTPLSDADWIPGEPNPKRVLLDRFGSGRYEIPGRARYLRATSSWSPRVSPFF